MALDVNGRTQELYVNCNTGNVNTGCDGQQNSGNANTGNESGGYFIEIHSPYGPINMNIIMDKKKHTRDGYISFLFLNNSII